MLQNTFTFFTRTPFITFQTEDKVVGGEPTSQWTKPTRSLFNERMYLDGDFLLNSIQHFLNNSKAFGLWKFEIVHQYLIEFLISKSLYDYSKSIEDCYTVEMTAPIPLTGKREVLKLESIMNA